MIHTQRWVLVSVVDVDLGTLFDTGEGGVQIQWIGIELRKMGILTVNGREPQKDESYGQ